MATSQAASKEKKFKEKKLDPATAQTLTQKSTPPSTPPSKPQSTPPSAMDHAILKNFPPEALAQALAEQLAIPVQDWHQLSSNRSVRAKEQVVAALVYLLKDHPEEALPRLTQAVGWLDRTLKAPPCPTHGEKAK